MAPLGLGYFVWAELRERRKRKEPAPATAPEAEPTPAPVERSTDDKLADRYGRSR